MNRFRTLVNEGKKPTQVVVAVPSALSAEMVAKLGFDSVMVDFQHGPMGFNDVYAMMLAISTTNATPMVRIPWNDLAVVPRVLDAGALGVIYPMVGTREEAERFVGACRYPPQGIRSLGPTRAAIGRMGEYMTSANREIMTIVQIETAEGFKNLKAIAATPHLDALFPGPADLALSFGEAPAFDYKTLGDSKMGGRLRAIIDEAHAAGIKVMMPVGDAPTAELMIRWGADWVCIGPDWVWMVTAGAKALEETRAAIAAGST
jgi:4-hydroxy-2-oxoheptanedioate aldolase